MNRIDRRWYQSLKFLSKWSLDDAFDNLKKNDKKKFNKYLEGEPWNTLHKLGYVTTTGGAHQIVTSFGLEQLRMLEDMRRKDFTLIASVVAILISLVAFAKSMGWI
ncbi:hypothetical protein GOV12_05605 [Candidatus Pacearchaeota archaeon]|nr:hypothetical protein [Candidatus Pacearchaeota archaeon]